MAADRRKVATLELLAEGERSHLLRMCTRLTGNPDAAEDLVQETLVEAWRHQDNLRESDDARRWLGAAAYHVCRRWRRKQGRETARSCRLPGDSDEMIPSRTGSAAGGSAIEVELERSELAGLLDRALALLPPETRQALLAHYVEGLPQAELAQRWGISEGACAVRLHRGRLALRRLLAPDTDAGGTRVTMPDQDGWEVTELWCPFCGSCRLDGRLVTSTGEVMLRCPHCSPSRGAPMINICKPDLLRGVRGYRRALARLASDEQDVYRRALVQEIRPCAGCGRPSRMRCGTMAALGPEQALVPQKFQQHATVEIVCGTCGVYPRSLLAGVALLLPEGLTFWRTHRRIQLAPQGTGTIESREAVITSFTTVSGSARLEVAFARDTLQVLRALSRSGLPGHDGN